MKSIFYHKELYKPLVLATSFITSVEKWGKVVGVLFGFNAFITF